MRAATIRDGEILVEEHTDPVPGAGEVLVRVRAAGLNGADMMQRRGFYPAHRPGPSVCGFATMASSACRTSFHLQAETSRAALFLCR